MVGNNRLRRAISALLIGLWYALWSFDVSGVSIRAKCREVADKMRDEYYQDCSAQGAL